VPELHAELRRLFGHDSFRAGQEPVVRAALAGTDTLALMPTGSGKSLTYQLAAMLRPTPTLVLSPLIALMKDQLDKLPAEVAAQATFVNSSLEAQESAARLAGVAAGHVKLLYAAPERLRRAAFVEALRRIGLGLVVVDEVHCVSMWGHDFRPDYLFIRRALAELGEPALLGMTATASTATAREIANALGREPEVVRTTVVRPNLRYDVEVVANAEDRLSSLLVRLRALRGAPAIVYARSRLSCERLARTLQSHGIRAEHYHAGLEPVERTRVQDAFGGGRTQVVVATTAFGMGIDKPDVRLVCLVNYPDSLESYVQMVGRAGRDGHPSDTLLLAGPHDAAALRRFALADVPDPDDLRRTYRALRDRGGVAEPQELATAAATERDPRVLVGMLEQAGLVRRGFDDGRALSADLPPPPDDAVARLETLLRRYAREALGRAERIVSFAESSACRHAQVAEHFGEQLDSPCNACDICAPRKRVAAALPSSPLPPNVAAAIVGAVAALAWPVGRRSLLATLRGSLSAPASARRSRAFGLLSAATDSDVRRWLRSLEDAGALVEVETHDGYRVVRAVPNASLPELGPAAAGDPDAGLVERLRAWRLERSRTDGVPAYVVLHDATLVALAAARPSSLAQLADVRGFGPAKLERYGDAVLGVVGAHAHG
jgi:ATP-dependent DNA helicase RecQ